MDFFDAFSLVLAISFVALGASRQRIQDARKYRKALVFYGVGLVCVYIVPAVFVAGFYAGIFTWPIGMLLVVLSFYSLCGALLVETLGEH